MLLLMVYVIYWSNPAVNEWKKNKAVLLSIQKYKKPAHYPLPKEDVGQVPNWLPRLVIDGKSYYLVDYFVRAISINNAPARSYMTGLLALNSDGSIVRDEILVNKIHRCQRFLYSTSSPTEDTKRALNFLITYTRVWFYKRHSPYIHSWLKSTPSIKQEIGHEFDLLIGAIDAMINWELMKRKELIIEGTYACDNNTARIKECTYDQMLEVADKIRAQKSIGLQYEKQYREGIDATQQIVKYLLNTKITIPLYIKNILVWLESTSQQGIEDLTSFHVPDFSDEYVPIYFPMDVETYRVWKERLEYVDSIEKRTK
jgi:hypothetical protein